MRMGRTVGDNEKKLFGNTAMLYLMTFSTQLLNLATVPYLTRVLGAVSYGKVGLALSYMAYVQIIIDFGFILSATRKIAEYRDNRAFLSEVFTSVAVAKMLLGGTVSIIFAVFVGLNDSLNQDFGFYMLYLLAYLINAMMPDYFYRGFENMKVITLRAVSIKILFTLLVFVFVHGPRDYLRIPGFNIAGNSAAVLLMYVDIKKNYSVWFCPVPWSTIWKHIKDSAQFFSSRISSVVYQASNAIILNIIYGSSAIIGYYTAADKIVSLVKSGSSPVADSLFPYMVKNKNFRLIKKVLCIFMPVIFVCAAICAVYAEEICVFLFGGEYRHAGLILRLLLPYIIVIFPTYILAFPVMVPLGLTKYANMSNVFGLVIQITLIIAAVICKKVNIYSICIITSITEVSVFMYRLYYVFKKYRSIKRRHL